jgi:GMP synthase PP-ATPase subunit
MALDPNMEPDPALSDLARSTLGAKAECFKMDSQTTVVPEAGTRPEVPIYKPVSWIKVDGDIDYDKLNALCVGAWSKLELPRILFELCANDAPKTRYVVGMRAVESAAAKLARPVRIDEAALLEIGKKIAAHTGASRVAYDISIKPPATIEFE